MEFKLNAILPHHKGVLLQKGRRIGRVFNSLFRTLLPIGKVVSKSSPKIIKNTARSPLGWKLRKSAKIELNTAKNLIESGDIKNTLKKSIEDSKQEVSNALNSSKSPRKRHISCIHLFMVRLWKGFINQLKIVVIDGRIQTKVKIT